MHQRQRLHGILGISRISLFCAFHARDRERPVQFATAFCTFETNIGACGANVVSVAMIVGRKSQQSRISSVVNQTRAAPFDAIKSHFLHFSFWCLLLTLSWELYTNHLLRNYVT